MEALPRHGSPPGQATMVLHHRGDPGRPPASRGPALLPAHADQPARLRRL